MFSIEKERNAVTRKGDLRKSHLEGREECLLSSPAREKKGGRKAGKRRLFVRQGERGKNVLAQGGGKKGEGRRKKKSKFRKKRGKEEKSGSSLWGKKEKRRNR